MPNNNQINNKHRGYVLVLSLVFLGIFSALAATYLNSATVTTRSAQHATENAQALALAEAGIDKAVSQLNQDSSYAGESNTVLAPGAFTITVSTLDASTRQITATGFVPDSTNPKASRTVKANVAINNSFIAFHYGVQTGAGGFTMSGGSSIDGSIYSNGDIIATNGVTITGSATAANPPALSADQVNDTPAISSCTSSTCITFANDTSTQDLAQSFKISAAISLNDVQIYIKKVGSPANATLRIVNDSNGNPGTETIMSGTLSAAAVTTNFGWVSVPLPATPVLDPGQTYWIVIDAASNSSKYYILGANTGGYANGVAKIGRYGASWSNTSPSGLDSYFKIYLGGGTSMIGGSNYSTGVYVGTTADDNAWAHTVQGATVTGNLYCQSGSHNNKACDTSMADPTPQPMPLSDSNIQAWKDDAATGGTISGDYHVDSTGTTLGPKKITGDLRVDSGGILTLTGTLWVEGAITVTGGGEVHLSSSYGENDGAIVSDGPVSISGGGEFYGSGTAGSYPFLITTSACPVAPGCNGANAVSLSGGSGTVAIIAQDGTAYIQGGSALKAITAKQIVMTGGASLAYDSGLVNSNFSSGPGGSWVFVPGTYAISP